LDELIIAGIKLISAPNRFFCVQQAELPSFRAALPSDIVEQMELVSK
jgi:hypothetical protein